MKHLLNTLDIIFGHFARGLTICFLYLFFGASAIVSLLFIPISFFEYNSGVADLDLSEIGLFILLLATLWRFYIRCQQVNLTWWQGLKRLALTISFAKLIYIFIYFCILYIGIIKQGEIGVEFLERFSDFKIFTFILLNIIAIYAATPLPVLVKDDEPESFNAPKITVNNEQAETPSQITIQSI